MNLRADTSAGEEGATLFRVLRTQEPDLPVMLLTARSHLESAVQLVKAGEADYIGAMAAGLKFFSDRQERQEFGNHRSLSSIGHLS